MSARATAALYNRFVEDFAALPGAGTAWLDARRAEAIKTVRDKGIPHRRVEDWKYSDLQAALDDKRPGYALSSDAARWEIEGVPGNVELFDLATLAKGAPDWVVRHLGKTRKNPNVMDAASLALARVGLALRIPRGIAVGTPIVLRLPCEGHARVLVVLEEGASATLIETDLGPIANMKNAGVELVLGGNAQLTHVRLDSTCHPEAAVLVEEISASVARGGSYCGHFANFGAKLSRLELNIALEGEGASAQLSGVSVVNGERHADVTTNIDHLAGQTRSTQLFKLIGGGHSRGVYQGKIVVREGAMGSDSRQTAKGLLLGPRAEIDLKPELEILADDVKCAHGAAVGDLDAESLFYLRARGIPEAEARALLMRAFLEDAITEIADEGIRATIWRVVEQAMLHPMEAPP